MNVALTPFGGLTGGVTVIVAIDPARIGPSPAELNDRTQMLYVLAVSPANVNFVPEVTVPINPVDV